MLCSFFVHGGAAKSGWTSYAPLSIISDHGPGINPFFNGQTLWICGMVFLISSSLLGSVNTITTIILLRAPGMTWMRLPFFVWAQLVTSFLLLHRISSAGSRRLHAVDGPRFWHQLFYADRACRYERPRLGYRRRRQSAALASTFSGSWRIPRFMC